MRRFIFLNILFFSIGPLSAAPKQGEMEQYQQIGQKPVATVQDVVDLILMMRGEFEKTPDAKKRIELAHAAGWIKNQQAADALDRGTLAYAIIQSYNVTRGWLFRLTNWNRYALRDVQEAGILSPRFSEGNHVSGAQLIGAMSAAEEYRTEKEEWSSHH